MIYHLITREQLRGAQDKTDYAPDSLAREGFIHFSQKHQVIAVANRFYPDRDDLLVLTVDPALLTAELRYEPPAHPDGSAATFDENELFPHLYGRLNLNAVIAIDALKRPPNGYTPPDWW